jgi:hypothetical protein
MEGVAFGESLECFGDEEGRMQDDDPWRIQGHHFLEPYADSAIDFFGCFISSERQLVKLVSQYFLQLLQLQVVAINQ